MRHLFVYPELFYRSSTVTAAYNCCALICSHCLCNSLCAGFELLEFEYSHGTVPHDSSSLCDLIGVKLDGLGTYVHSHPAVLHLIGIDCLCFALGIESVTDFTVYGKKKLYALLLGFLLKVDRKIKFISLAERITNVHSVGSEEGIRHASAYDNGVSLFDKVLYNEYLVGDL